MAGPEHMARFGITKDSLKTAPNLLKHAGGSLLQVLGSHPIFVIHNDKLVETEIYFASGVTNIYLSLDSFCAVFLFLARSKEAFNGLLFIERDENTLSLSLREHNLKINI